MKVQSDNSKVQNEIVKFKVRIYPSTVDFKVQTKIVKFKRTN